MMNVLKENKDGHGCIVYNDKNLSSTLGNWLQAAVVALGIWHPYTVSQRLSPAAARPGEADVTEQCEGGRQRVLHSTGAVLVKMRKQVGKHRLSDF